MLTLLAATQKANKQRAKATKNRKHNDNVNLSSAPRAPRQEKRSGRGAQGILHYRQSRPGVREPKEGECSAPRCRAPFSNIPGGSIPTRNQVHLVAMPIPADIDQTSIQNGFPIAQLLNQMKDPELFQVSASLKYPVYTPKTHTALQMADPTERTPLNSHGAI
jgi:hypothetical protein